MRSNIRNAKLVALALVNPKNLDISTHSVEIISIYSRFRISKKYNILPKPKVKKNHGSKIKKQDK